MNADIKTAVDKKKSFLAQFDKQYQRDLDEYASLSSNSTHSKEDFLRDVRTVAALDLEIRRANRRWLSKITS